MYYLNQDNPVPNCPSSCASQHARRPSIQHPTSGVLLTTQFTYWKCLGTCDELFCLSHTLQSALEGGQEVRIVQIDFSAAFVRVNHLCLLYNLAPYELEVLSCLYSNSFYETDHSTLVDGCLSKLVSVALGGPSGQCFRPLIVIPVHVGTFFYSGK